MLPVGIESCTGITVTGDLQVAVDVRVIDAQVRENLPRSSRGPYIRINSAPACASSWREVQHEFACTLRPRTHSRERHKSGS